MFSLPLFLYGNCIYSPKRLLKYDIICILLSSSIQVYSTVALVNRITTSKASKLSNTYKASSSLGEETLSLLSVVDNCIYCSDNTTTWNLESQKTLLHFCPNYSTTGKEKHNLFNYWKQDISTTCYVVQVQFLLKCWEIEKRVMRSHENVNIS